MEPAVGCEGTHSTALRISAEPALDERYIWEPSLSEVLADPVIRARALSSRLGPAGLSRAIATYCTVCG